MPDSWWKQDDQENGFSMVSVLVSMAILGLVAYLSSQSYRQMARSARKTDVIASAREVENLLVHSVSTRFKNFVLTDKCVSDPNTFFNSINAGGVATLEKLAPVFYTASGAVGPIPSAAQPDVNRCVGTAFSAATPLATSSSFYACFNIKTLPALANSTRDSFARNSGAFLEVLIKVKDMQLDALRPCQSVLIDAGFGLEIYYALHWASENANGDAFYEHKIGTVNAALKSN